MYNSTSPTGDCLILRCSCHWHGQLSVGRIRPSKVMAKAFNAAFYLIVQALLQISPIDSPFRIRQFHSKLVRGGRCAAVLYEFSPPWNGL
jgi:hypothetical protein